MCEYVHRSVMITEQTHVAFNPQTKSVKAPQTMSGQLLAQWKVVLVFAVVVLITGGFYMIISRKTTENSVIFNQLTRESR